MKDTYTRWILAKQNVAQATAELKKVEAEVIQGLEKDRRKSLSVSVGKQKYRITYVRPMGYDLDEAGLKKALGAKKVKKISVSRISTKLLEEAIDNGDISPEQVSPYLKDAPRNPYLRLSEVKTDG